MAGRTVLILGGVSEAAALAEALASGEGPGLRVITSLAGRTSSPRPLPGEVRVGGFGGIPGLVAYLREQAVDAVIDGTHTFAAGMSGHAPEACRELAIPRLYLGRPSWRKREGDRWREVADAEAAARALPELGRRVFLTTGQQDLGRFSGLDDLWFLIRTVEPITATLPKRSLRLRARGPFTEENEIALLKAHRIDVLVTKASGGEATYAKIAAARWLGLPVVMIKRPPPPQGPKAASLEHALAWLQRQTVDRRQSRQAHPEMR